MYGQRISPVEAKIVMMMLLRIPYVYEKFRFSDSLLHSRITVSNGIVATDKENHNHSLKKMKWSK